jgi:quercetin dioxygenase-like cupin family protein
LLTPAADLCQAYRMVDRQDALSGKVWPNKVFTLSECTTTHELFGNVTVYFEGKTEQLKNMIAGSLVLKPGEEPHPPHQHPEEEFMLIAEGQGEIVVNGQTTHVSPGSLMYCEGNALHGIKNTGTTPMRFSYFKWIG